VAVVPAAVVALTSTVPAVGLGGATAVITASELTVKLEAGVLPNLTALAPVKSWPMSATEAPPVVEPEAGLSELIPGGGWTSALKRPNVGARPVCP
jgi:hypothetical protein